MEIFMSYSSADSQTAFKLATQLDRDGFIIWRDQERMQSGARFSAQLEQAIKRADIVLALISPQSLESRWVENEIIFALDVAGKSVIPLMIENGLKLPLYMVSLHYEDMFTHWDSGYQKLKKRLSDNKFIAPSLHVNSGFNQLNQSDIRADINPFLYGSAVPENSFWGRLSALSEIRNRIAADTLQSISIVGNRRIGKTSLLNFVKKRSHTFLPSYHHWIIVYLDMMDSRARTVHDVMKTLRRAIRNQTGRECWSEADDGNLSILGDFLEEISESGIRLVLLLDEWESIMAFNELDHFLETLRSAGSLSRIGMVIATSHRLEELTRVSKLTSPFYNIFSTIYLGLFLKEEWVNPVKQGFERSQRTIEEKEIELIEKMAGGHPYLTQLAASMIWDATVSGSVNAIEIYERFMSVTSPFFSQLWQRQSEQEANIIRAVMQLNNIPVSKHQKLKLQAKGILDSDGDIFSQAFADFILREIESS